MIRGFLILLVEQLLVNDDRIADEEVGNVVGQQRVYALLSQGIADLLVVHGLQIVILREQLGILGDVAVHRIIPGLGDQKPVVLQWLLAHLLLGPVIHRPGNHTPANIGVRQVSTPDRCPGRDGKLGASL